MHKGTKSIMLPELTARQQEILFAIVHKYIELAAPIGSRYLREECKWHYSPATIRNEMNLLEELSFITQPHTSAGRIPCNQGYRAFVNALLGELGMKHRERALLPTLLSRSSYDDWDELFSELVSKLAELLSNITLIATGSGRIYTAGLTAFLRQPEHLELQHAMPLIEFLETKRDLMAFFQSLQFAGQKVAISIGDEHVFRALAACSSLSAYFVHPAVKGWISVLGPTRMPYRRSLSLLQQVASELEQLEY